MYWKTVLTTLLITPLTAQYARPEPSTFGGEQYDVGPIVEKAIKEQNPKPIKSKRQFRSSRPTASGPLCDAIQKGRLDDIRRLTDSRRGLNDRCPDGSWPLYIAAEKCNEHAVIALGENGAESNESDRGYSALWPTLYRTQFIDSMGKRFLRIADYLLEKGCDPNRPRMDDGWTPVMLAAYFGDLPMIKLLLRHGAHINARSRKGETPFLSLGSEGMWR